MQQSEVQDIGYENECKFQKMTGLVSLLYTKPKLINYPRMKLLNYYKIFEDYFYLNKQKISCVGEYGWEGEETEYKLENSSSKQVAVVNVLEELEKCTNDNKEKNIKHTKNSKRKEYVGEKEEGSPKKKSSLGFAAQAGEFWKDEVGGEEFSSSGGIPPELIANRKSAPISPEAQQNSSDTEEFLR